MDDINVASRSVGLEPIFQAGLLRLRLHPTVDTPAGGDPPVVTLADPLGSPTGTLRGFLPQIKEMHKEQGLLGPHILFLGAVGALGLPPTF